MSETESARAPLTVAEVSHKLRLHPNTIRSMIKAGSLPAVRVGHQYRVPAEAFDALLRPAESAS